MTLHVLLLSKTIEKKTTTEVATNTLFEMGITEISGRWNLPLGKHLDRFIHHTVYLNIGVITLIYSLI